MLTPIEIKKQEFSRSVRGYDVSEVKSFLETVADDIAKLNMKLRTQEIEIEKLQSELKPMQSMEQTMKEAVFNTQETLRTAQEGSRKEADLVIKGAEIEAEKIIRNAHIEGRSIRQEVDVLIERRDSFVRKLKHLLRSELELIDLLETTEPDEDGTVSKN